MRIGVLGAGAIGAFLGARLGAAGHEVVLVGRAKRLEPIATRGVVAEDLDGSRREARVRCSEDPEALRECEVVLITTKAADVERAAASLAQQAQIVVALQNGVDHPRIVRETIGAPRARAGTVSFNVVWCDERTLRRGTTGPIVIESRGGGDDAIPSRTIQALRSAGLDARGADPIEPVLWTKLVFNLNNAVNALSGLPLREQLALRSWRRVVAACQREALDATRAAGIRPVRLGRMDPWVAARVLPLPDPIFRALAGAMVRIDPKARSSTAEDLEAGRKTEIDWLNGAVVRLGERVGVPTPVNRRVVEAIHRAEQGDGAAVSPESLLGG